MRRTPGIAASLAARCLVIAAAITVLSGCSADNPLNLGRDTEICTPVASGSKFVVGDIAVGRADGDVRLGKVQLVDPIGVEVSEAYLMPIVDDAFYIAPFPPTIAGWDQREPVEGSVIEAGESMNIAVVVRRTSAGTDATIEGLRVEYESGFLRHSTESDLRYVLADACF